MEKSKQKVQETNVLSQIIRFLLSVMAPSLEKDSGVKREYMFSNFEFAEMFSNLFLDYKNRVKVVGSNKLCKR